MNVDVRLIYEWRSENLMSRSFAIIKYVAKIASKQYPRPIALSKKLRQCQDLEVVFSENLSWSPHVKKIAETARKTLHTYVTKHIKSCTCQSKNCVCLMLFQSSYASALWMPNKGDLEGIVNVHRKALAWILGPNSLTYKKNLVSLDVLVLRIFQELLIRAKIWNSNIQIDWTKYMSMLYYGSTRNSQTCNFLARPMSLRSCECDFWCRACQLANRFNDYFKEDFFLNLNNNKLLQA